MSEDTDKVGNSGEGESQSSTSSQQSPDLATIQKRLDELAAQFKGIQKGTDKVNARVENRVNEVLSNAKIGRIAELAKAGKSSEEIERDLLLEDLLAERKRAASGSQAVGNGEKSDGVNEGAILSQLVSVFGLDANDKTVAEALSKGDLSAVANVVKSKLSTPEPDSTTQPPLTPKQKSVSTADEIEKGYLAAIAKVPRGNQHMASTVKAEWRKKAREAGFTLNV